MSASAYKTELDIGNRACQIIGVPRIKDFTSTKAGLEIGFCYDKLREAELQRNVWRSSIRRAIIRAIDNSTLLWTPQSYAAGTTWSLGQVVVDTNGDWWQSKVNSNIGNTPAIGAFWAHYFGPDTFDPYVAQTSTDAPPTSPVLSTTAGGALGLRTEYYRLTYVGANGESSPSVELSQSIAASFLSKVTSPAAQTGETKYNVYASSTKGTETLQNAAPITLGTDWTEPATGLKFGAGLPPGVIPSFSAGELTILGGTVYLSLVSNNTDTPPTPNWLSVGGTTVSLKVLYPIGTGPARDLTTRNYFRLPHGFLRRAPQDPKAGLNPFLGAPRDAPADDWLLENDYLVTSETGPIMIRFVSDLVDVPDMNAMFCEGLAARIAFEVCEPLTQAIDKQARATATYNRAMAEARMVNAIEVGTEGPPEDDYITARY